MHTGGRSSPAFAGGRERRRTRGVIDRECVSGCSQFLSAPVLVVGSLPGSSFLSPGSFFLFAVLFRSLATFRRTGQSNEVVCGCFSSVGSCLCIVCASCVWELFDISIVWIGCNKETKRHVVSLCSRATSGRERRRERMRSREQRYLGADFCCVFLWCRRTSVAC